LKSSLRINRKKKKPKKVWKTVKNFHLKTRRRKILSCLRLKLRYKILNSQIKFKRQKIFKIRSRFRKSSLIGKEIFKIRSRFRMSRLIRLLNLSNNFSIRLFNLSNNFSIRLFNLSNNIRT